jgi:hypothetical protein
MNAENVSSEMPKMYTLSAENNESLTRIMMQVYFGKWCKLNADNGAS